MVAMSNILQSSLSSCWRVLLQTFLSPDSAITIKELRVDIPASEVEDGTGGIGGCRSSETVAVSTILKVPGKLTSETRDCVVALEELEAAGGMENVPLVLVKQTSRGPIRLRLFRDGDCESMELLRRR